VISGLYTKESVKNGKKEVSSRLHSDKITTHWYRILTFAKCTTVMTVVLTVTSGLGSSIDLRKWYWEWHGIGSRYFLV
jgi:hypothetical protein